MANLLGATVPGRRAHDLVKLPNNSALRILKILKLMKIVALIFFLMKTQNKNTGKFSGLPTRYFANFYPAWLKIPNMEC